MKFLKGISIAVALSASPLVNAAMLSPTSTTGTGSYNNLAYISDGSTPSEGTQWQTQTTWWTGKTPTFTFDYGSSFNITDIELSVDNNDDYRIEWSSDSASWSTLFDINRGHGEKSWGVDTLSTDSTSPEYIAGIDFSPVVAQYLRIFATGGDNYYSVGEFTAYGTTPSAVPVPAAAFLFGPALLGFIGLRRKLKA